MENENKNQHSGLPKDIVVVNFQKIISRLISFWWLFIICIGLSVAAGQFYLRYTTFEYSARAILLIKDTGKSGTLSEQSIISAGQGLSGGKSMDNEIQILKSLTLMEKVVKRLNLQINYFRIGNFKETELYDKSPILLDTFSFNKADFFGFNGYLEVEDYNSFIFKKNEQDEEGLKVIYGEMFTTPKGIFRIRLNPDVAIIPGLYRIKVTNLQSAAYRYKGRLNIQRIGDQFSSSVLEINIQDPVGQKASDLVNTLIDVYNEEEINDENQVYRNTINFIDKRVVNLVSELDSVEGGIQRFKSSNEIISEDAASSMNYTLSEIRGAVQEMSEYEVQESLLKSLELLLQSKRETYELIPFNLIAETPVLTNLVGQYNELVIENRQLANTASEINPVRINLQREIESTKDLIIETIQNLQQDLQIPIKEIERNIERLRSSMSSIPGIDKRLLEKMRTQAVKEKLFLYLLQKREETALSEAITTAKTRTIDRARESFFPVYPQPKMILTFSILLGLFVPVIFISILGLFDNKVDSEETIKQLTNIPILGRISFNKGGKEIVVKQGNRSAINEMFRLLRTNLNFLNHNKNQQTFLVTSSISGEGKTFIALNLGITLALADKKVIILGMDLRKPKLGSYFNHEEGKGITNFLIGQSELEDVIQVYKETPNLSYITSGPTPPNPGELILSNKIEKMIGQLREQYDYILIDTPPIGLVSDALLLRSYVDNILIVVRQKYTLKEMVKNLENMYSKNELDNSNIIFNGVKQGKRYYGYGGYHTEYGEGYYVEDES